jgi:hypothetical protein
MKQSKGARKEKAVPTYYYPVDISQMLSEVEEGRA